MWRDNQDTSKGGSELQANVDFLPLLSRSHPRRAETLWSFSFGRHSPSRVLSPSHRKPPEDFHLKEGDKAELSCVANYSQRTESAEVSGNSAADPMDPLCVKGSFGTGPLNYL